MKQLTGKAKFYLPAMLILGTVLLLFFTPGAGWGQESDTPGGADAPDGSLYLPLVRMPGNRIYGTVTDGGLPAQGVELALQWYNGVITDTLTTTTTGIDGKYTFNNVPPLAAGQRYYVEYFNVTAPAHLFLWQTRILTSFTSSSVEHIGDFDIANIGLIAPADLDLVSLPYTFQWTPRPATPDDMYWLGLYDGVMHPIEPVGYLGSYELTSLPPLFQYCTVYQWGVLIASPDGGVGISGSAYLVTFYTAAPSGIHGCVTFNGGPASGVSLDLRYWNGSAYDTRAMATTNSNGYFAFTGVPSLIPENEEEYYVRYQSPEDDTRLGFYGTRNLLAYTTGDSVHIGDFDITDFNLLTPGNNSIVPLPQTFSWEQAPVLFFYSYIYELLSEAYFGTLTFENNYTMTELPEGVTYDTLYGWDAGILDYYGGEGYTFDTYGVQFSDGGMNASPSGPFFSTAERELRYRNRLRAGAPVNPKTRWLKLREQGWLRIDR